MTVNASASKIYLDGALVGSGDGFAPQFKSTLYIGKRYSGDNHFQGTLDEILIYDRVLSDEEIADLYNSNLSWNGPEGTWEGECTAPARAPAPAQPRGAGARPRAERR